MPNYICVTCGVQYAESVLPPERCAICEDERQYVGWEGQRWTTLGDLRADHHNRLAPEDLGLTGIGTVPKFAIGQRALLLRSAHGNVLWDCISVVDDTSVAAVQALGGVAAIAVSHPHFYGAVVEWSRALGDVPVYLHAADRQWVMRPDPVIVAWEEETRTILPGVTLIRCGGHFPGGTVLHWAEGAERRGALLTGDILMVAEDRRTVSFMYSYPNLIPLDAATVRRIGAAVEPFEFERVYGGWWGRKISEGGKAAVRRSVERYLRAIAGD